MRVQEWAKHTGKYREGVDKPHYARWKTRLRCAFNKATDIQEIVSERQTLEPEPYRVYQFVAGRGNTAQLYVTTGVAGIGVTLPLTLVQPRFDGCISPHTLTSFCFVCCLFFGFFPSSVHVLQILSDVNVHFGIRIAQEEKSVQILLSICIF